MKAYKIYVELKRFDQNNWVSKEEVFIISDTEDIMEHVEMSYGCWYYIGRVGVEEISSTVHVSKGYLIEEAKKLVKIG